jgi:hypothetical protein
MTLSLAMVTMLLGGCAHQGDRTAWPETGPLANGI